MKLTLAVSLVASSLFLVAPANAQGATNTPSMVPGAAASVPAMKSDAPKAARTAKSKECSAEADKQGLHGKTRKA
ncbi:phosphate starvation-inducible protein PsiF [Methylobacterium sp. J-048]|uniref:phosphate starvation-inducible protein PsiF n=1 Tax=Methylobacterium sp. J-048 TaxID=2836635 RepID=UPI001FBA1373|nr:phosphate starvation-inducible protein PsiF [Methylobacterium sp. J-048]MCJ2059211.1 phosphate starvation-inducible protein PsiF [Methylobacterium sp. J-048]